MRVPLKLRFLPGTNKDSNGILSPVPVKKKISTQSFTDNPKQTQTDMVTNETTVKSDRLVYLTDTLKNNVRLSGRPKISLRAGVDKPDSNLTVLIVDYGTDTRIDHESKGEGIRTLTEESCWGESSAADDACYKETEKTIHTAPYEVVTRGWFDPQNWKSILIEDELRPEKTYKFQWNTLPEDYVFKAGHRIGVIVAGSDSRRTVPSTTEATYYVHLGQSYAELPLVGVKKTK